MSEQPLSEVDYVEIEPPQTIHGTLLSFLTTVVGLAFFQYAIFRDEIKYRASPRRFWIALIGAVAIYFLIKLSFDLYGANIALSIAFFKGMLYYIIDVLLTNLLTLILPFLLASWLSYTYFRVNRDEHYQALITVFVTSLFFMFIVNLAVAWLFRALYPTITDEASLLRFYMPTEFAEYSANGYAVSPSDFIFGSVVLRSLLSIYFYALVFYGFRIAHPESKRLDIFIGLATYVACLEVSRYFAEFVLMASSPWLWLQERLFDALIL